MFQSTRPRGARHDRDCHDVSMVTVSIHAPARGATSSRQVEQISPIRFNPRARAGRDRESALVSAASDTFQSTRPRGARPPVDVGRVVISVCFNPRARAGRDAKFADQLSIITDSFNPRARAGRDFHLRCALGYDDVSIHAPARGATRYRGSSLLY